MSVERQAGTRWTRRARPLLGSLVEVGVASNSGEESVAIDAAFVRVREVQDELSRFEPDSDVARFHALRRGDRMAMRPAMRDVMRLALALRDASDGAFDISVGTSPWGWCCAVDGDVLHKLDDDVRLDLGGIGKGFAVDRAVQALIEHGCAAGWVNAGGDLRSFGDVEVPIRLRDERSSGARPFATLHDGAFATSDFGLATRSRLALPARSAVQAHLLADERSRARPVHASVAAPLCAWADALTKIVASTGDATHPTLDRYDAVAWIH